MRLAVPAAAWAARWQPRLRRGGLRRALLSSGVVALAAVEGAASEADEERLHRPGAPRRRTSASTRRGRDRRSGSFPRSRCSRSRCSRPASASRRPRTAHSARFPASPRPCCSTAQEIAVVTSSIWRMAAATSLIEVTAPLVASWMPCTCLAISCVACSSGRRLFRQLIDDAVKREDGLSRPTNSPA